MNYNDGKDVRVRALELAVDRAKHLALDGGDGILETAKEYEKFILGEKNVWSGK